MPTSVEALSIRFVQRSVGSLCVQTNTVVSRRKMDQLIVIGSCRIYRQEEILEDKDLVHLLQSLKDFKRPILTNLMIINFARTHRALSIYVRMYVQEIPYVEWVRMKLASSR